MANIQPDAIHTDSSEKNGNEHCYTLKILSQNMWGVYLGDYGPNYKARLSRLARVARGYDVIMIQEFTLFKLFGLTLGATYMENFYQEILEYLPYSTMNNVTDSLPYLFGGNSGLIVFSRYPVISIKESMFTQYPWFEGNNKGFQHACILIQRRRPVLLHVINTHLYAHWRPWVRPAQLQEIADYKKNVREKEMILIAGDFNICPRTYPNAETEFRTMCDAMKPLELKSNPKDVTYPSEGSTLDHCFVGGDNVLSVEVTPVEIVYKMGEGNELPISDHKGLSIRLSMVDPQ